MGCRVTKVFVEGKYVPVIVCSRAALTQRCVVCRTQYDIRLCDYPLRGVQQGQTCDRPVCGTHATHQEPDVDWCPSHARLVAAHQHALEPPARPEPAACASDPLRREGHGL